MVPAIVRPTVPPICWKNVRLLVATPISSCGTEFWTISVNTANDGPIAEAGDRHPEPQDRALRVGPEVCQQEQANGKQHQRPEDQRLVAMGPGDDLARRVAVMIRPKRSGRML